MHISINFRGTRSRSNQRNSFVHCNMFSPGYLELHQASLSMPLSILHLNSDTFELFLFIQLKLITVKLMLISYRDRK
ncbi:unnamed protein product [Allacma fusca]|uniref:Uncharacterized protein n=1 Tax=Allacma fusca TaxID=39272 RepID=A0A8J2LDN3_9HEXA|nr:unnamed protein product [Allacma fusca]